MAISPSLTDMLQGDFLKDNCYYVVPDSDYCDIYFVHMAGIFTEITHSVIDKDDLVDAYNQTRDITWSVYNASMKFPSDKYIVSFSNDNVDGDVDEINSYLTDIYSDNSKRFDDVKDRDSFIGKSFGIKERVTGGEER